jgi:hypothetical protein
MAMSMVSTVNNIFYRRTRLSILVGLCCTFSLLSCGSFIYPDVNKDPAKNNKTTFQRDAIDCADAYPESGSGIHIRQRIGCMNLKGWY